MRTFLCSLVLLALLGASQAANAQTWTWENPLPQGNNLRDASRDWAVGYSGTILHNLVPVSPPEGISGEAIACVGDENCWIGMARPHGIFHTTDGGQSWTQQYSDSSAFVYDLSFVDELYGWALISRGYAAFAVLRTTDGGNSWIETQDPRFDYAMSISFFDRQNGWMGTDLSHAFHTTDGGVTWTQVPIGQFGLAKICFGNLQQLWGVVWHQIWHSTDSGESWTRQAVENQTYLTDIVFLDTLRGWAVGGNGTVLTTTDGGNDWITAISIPANLYLESVSYYSGPDGTHGIAVGDGGLIMTSTDAGAHWSESSHDLSNHGWLSGVSFVNPDVGWITGAEGNAWHGVIMKATRQPGELHWQWTTVAEYSHGFGDVAALDEQTVYVAADSGRIFATTDGGVTWTPQSTGRAWEWNRLKFLDHNVGFVLCPYGGIARTTNGGNQWISHRIPPEGQGWVDAVWDMSFLDSLNGWVVGDFTESEDCAGGYIWHTTDGGASWTQQFFSNDTCVYAVDFLDSQTGWATGDPNVLLKTTNGGQTWTAAQNNFYCGPRSIQFFDALHGVATVGYWYYTTSDGGDTWQEVVLPTTGHISDYMFLDISTGWAVGQDGTIMAYRASPSLTPPMSSAAKPKSFTLSAYPNPFNPVAVLSFDVPQSGRIQLAVYDITGRKVTTLTDQVYAAGNYRASFDGANLPSGIYFARLSGSGFSKTQKLVLLK